MKGLKDLRTILILFDGEKISYINLNKPDNSFTHLNLNKNYLDKEDKYKASDDDEMEDDTSEYQLNLEEDLKNER